MINTWFRPTNLAMLVRFQLSTRKTKNGRNKTSCRTRYTDVQHCTDTAEHKQTWIIESLCVLLCVWWFAYVKLCECTIVCLWQPSNDSLSYYSQCYSIRNILSVHWSSASTSSYKLCHTSIACTVTAADVSTQEMVTPSRTWLIMSTWVQVFTNVMTVHLVACQQLLRLRTVTRFSAAQSTMRCVTKSCCVD